MAPELCPIRDDAGANLVKLLDRDSSGIARRLQHARRHRAHEHCLRHSLRTMATDVAGHLAAARRVSDMNDVRQVELLDEFRKVVGVRVHVIPVPGLGRPSVTAPVVGDGAIPVGRHEEQLLVPCVGVEWPAVAEDDWLTRAPILVEDLRSVFGADGWHTASLRP